METLLEKYARLALLCGVNLQKGQTLLIQSDIAAAEFAEVVTREAYAFGAKEVVVHYSDERITRLHYLYQSSDTLCTIHDWKLECKSDYLKKGACILHIISDTPGIFADCDTKKITEARLAYAKASKDLQRYTMNNECAWSIVAIPSPAWAMQVFPDLTKEDAMKKLWQAIYDSVYIKEGADPVREWKSRNAHFHQRVAALNKQQFRMLHFSNGLGTDLKVRLVEHHRWEGGSEKTTKGIDFNANLPTEEVYTMPHREGADGIVYASKPLDHNGVLIKDFYIVFKNGKVVDFDAKQGKEALASLIHFDEGSNRLGEVALVPYDSPISLSGLLFYNTLFDENASCHLALGDAYPSCLEHGVQMTEEELRAAGANQSMAHVDFMFGTADLSVKGIGRYGEIEIMKNGNFTSSFR